MKIWHAASNNGINLFKIIVSNNHNYNLKGIIDNFDFCHNRAALIYSHTRGVKLGLGLGFMQTSQVFPH